MRKLVLVFTTLILFYSNSYSIQNRMKLKGLEDIYLKVEFVNPKLRQYGITKSVIEEDIKLQFKDAGLELLPDYKFHTSNYYPVLCVKLAAEVDEDFYFSVPYNIRIELREVSYLRRDASVITHAVSWRTSTLGAYSFDRVSEIRMRIYNEVDKFIQAYLRANPEANDNNPNSK